MFLAADLIAEISVRILIAGAESPLRMLLTYASKIQIYGEFSE
jgi:hypothetical protein